MLLPGFFRMYGNLKRRVECLKIAGLPGRVASVWEI